ncbi:MAG: pyruvate kinase [Deltaproteobacteria bacterium]|nr:pyruvate kinase [Deltaproteobacteria bacterium]
MKILLLDDNPVNRTILNHQLSKIGHQVEEAENGQQGFLLATSRPYDLFICDIMMPQWDGFQFIEAMNVVSPGLPVVVISGHMDRGNLQQKLRAYPNVAAILSKPVKVEDISRVLDLTSNRAVENIRKMARIVCTIGPASASQDVIEKMILAGMDVARLNFSHGVYEEHEKALNYIRAAEEKWQRPVAVLMDLCGPKIRTGEMRDGKIELLPGRKIIIQADSVSGTAERFSTIAPEVLADLRQDDPVLLDDGLLELQVERPGNDEVVCRVVRGGTLGSHKGINLPATPLSLPSLTAKDRENLEWGLNHSIDFAALSFVRAAADISELKELVKKSGKRDIKIVAKIEKPEAVSDMEGIIRSADAVMIARGDLGVEMPAARVPWIQRKIISLCWTHNTPVITATQMLESMTTHSRPTRAEVSDVSLAIAEGTDAVMLSGETAVGGDPVNVVRTMAAIISESERHHAMEHEHDRILTSRHDDSPALTAAASLSDTAATLVIDFDKGLYQHVSKWNRKTATLLVTHSLHTARHSCLYKNIIPIITKEKLSRDQTVFWAIDKAKSLGYLKPGDTLAVLEGSRHTQGGIPQLGALQIVSVE